MHYFYIKLKNFWAKKHSPLQSPQTLPLPLRLPYSKILYPPLPDIPGKKKILGINSTAKTCTYQLMIHQGAAKINDFVHTELFRSFDAFWDTLQKMSANYSHFISVVLLHYLEKNWIFNCTTFRYMHGWQVTLRSSAMFSWLSHEELCQNIRTNPVVNFVLRRH